MFVLILQVLTWNSWHYVLLLTCFKFSLLTLILLPYHFYLMTTTILLFLAGKFSIFYLMMDLNCNINAQKIWYIIFYLFSRSCPLFWCLVECYPWIKYLIYIYLNPHSLNMRCICARRNKGIMKLHFIRTLKRSILIEY